MKVLTICPTYGRLPYLGRLVASFLSQTHIDSELVIINDDPNITLRFDHDRVTIVNINKKHLLDVKRNIGAIMGRNYDLIMPLDDDDIFLPEQIAYHVRMFQENPNIDLFKNSDCFVVYKDFFTQGICSGNAIAYTPDAYLKHGAYNFFNKNSSGDAEFYKKFTNKLAVHDFENTQFVYNFCRSTYHLSYIDEKKLESIAESQRIELGCHGNFDIVPDFDEYNKFITLSNRFKTDNSKIAVSTNIIDGKINTFF